MVPGQIDRSVTSRFFSEGTKREKKGDIGVRVSNGGRRKMAKGSWRLGIGFI